MSTPEESHAYFTDAENVAEMARLTRQAQMLSRQIGVLPSQISLPQDIYEDRRTIMKFFQPFLVAQGVAPQEELEQLYDRTMEDMRSPSFRAIVYYQTTWGEKPV